MLENGIFISDKMIVAKANQELSKINGHKINSELQLNFSNGFKPHDFHGESGDLSVKKIMNNRTHFIDELRNYPSNEIWNADDFVLVCIVSRDSIVGPVRIPRKKKKGYHT